MADVEIEYMDENGQLRREVVDESLITGQPQTSLAESASTFVPALMPVPTPIPLSPEEQRQIEANRLSGPEKLAAIAMAPAQGLAFNWLDEAIGQISPETGEYLGDIYGKFQASDPIVAGIGEIAGPGVAAKGLGLLGRYGVPTAQKGAQLLEALQKGGPLSQAAQAALSGAGATQGDTYNRAIGAAFGGAAGAAGGALGSALGQFGGKGREAGMMAASNLPEAEQVIAQSYAGKRQADQFGQLMAEAGQDISAPMTFAEMGGKGAILPATAGMTEGQFIQDILRGREAARPERLQSTMEAALGGQGQLPRELQTEGAMMSRDVLKEAERRQAQAGRELYSPLEVEPELTGGQKVTMGEGISARNLAREEAKFGRTIGKAEVQIDNLLDDVADDLGEDFANSVMEPGISAAQRNARIKALGARGYENADLLQDAFAQADEAQIGIVAKNRLRKDLAALTEPLNRKDWDTLLNHIYVGEKRVPKLSEIPVDELKMKVVGAVKALNREAKAKNAPTVLGSIKATAMQKLERALDQGFERIFPGIKEADYTFATKTIPEAFGGMEEMARNALRQMSTFDPKSPADVTKIGKIIAQLDPADVSAILRGSETIGKPGMREAMRKGYVGTLKRKIATQKPGKTIDFFDANSNQRQILELLAGPEESQRVMRTLKRERNMAITEQKALRGSPTTPSKMAAEELGEEVKGSRMRNIFQRGANIFRSAPAALDALIEIAPELKDATLRNEILQVYGMQGLTAYQKMQQLEPVIRKLQKMKGQTDLLARIGSRVGAKAAEREAMSFGKFTEEKRRR